MKTIGNPTCLAALSLIAMTGLYACSDHSDAPETPDATDGSIRFTANTEYSRLGDITTHNLKDFNVYAYTREADRPVVFMDNVKVTKNSTNVWSYTPVKYWPAGKAVDFYAYAPEEWLDGQSPLSAVQYEAYPGIEDIIYAVSPQLSGTPGYPNPQVLFNFRHALAKVTVKMSSTNKNLKVNVSNVALSHLMTKGNFHFPDDSTAEPVSATTTGSWSDTNSPAPYMMHMSQTPDDIITLTSTATDMGTTTIPGARYLIPQQLVWESNGSGEDTYIAVMCSVYDAQTGHKLWPNDNTPKDNIVEGSTFGDGLLKFPLSTSAFHEWKPGTHYIYNLIINSNEDMGAIEFGAPNVETFVDVETSYH